VPAQNTSNKRKGFGIFVGSLRDDCGDGQMTFAVRLNMSRTTIGMIETGKRRPTKTFLGRLERAFPERKQEIKDAAKRYRQSTLSTTNGPTQKNAERLIAARELQEVKTALGDALDAMPIGDRDRPVWMLACLGRVDILLGNLMSGGGLLYAAIETGESQGAPANEMIPLFDELADCRAQEGFQTIAQEVVDDGLERYPTAAALWYRKGMLCWYEHAFSNGHAALSMALRHQATRLQVLSARGQLLAEWGDYEAALVDLNKVIYDAKANPAQKADALAARSYALHMIGGVTNTLDSSWDFRQSEAIMPDSAWLHYLRGLCDADKGKRANAEASFERALNGHVRSLSPSQVTKVKQIQLRFAVDRAIAEAGET
jgi:tetratricopeptide (TPR) repeat protein